jgi:RNA recognition motif-containing protein
MDGRQFPGLDSRRLTGPQRISMSKNLYVGNLAFSTTADDLREAFAQHGTVTRAQVVSDRETGRSRGFGFVEMADGGDEAITQMNGTEFQGRTLTVNEARPREERPRSGGDRPRSSFSRRY